MRRTSVDGRSSSNATWSMASLTMIPVVCSFSPGSLFFSRTVTRAPARASAVAQAKPAKLAPTTTQAVEALKPVLLMRTTSVARAATTMSYQGAIPTISQRLAYVKYFVIESLAKACVRPGQILRANTMKPVNPIRLIAIDIDGTLLDPHFQVTQRNRDALRAAHDA